METVAQARKQTINLGTSNLKLVLEKGWREEERREECPKIGLETFFFLT
jgi:hypothetical protein